MNPKKTPRPKPRKNKNRSPRRSATREDGSIVNRKSKKSCLHCRYWSMWDGSCAARAMALDDFSPIDPDTPACKEFQPE